MTKILIFIKVIFFNDKNPNFYKSHNFKDKTLNFVKDPNFKDQTLILVKILIIFFILKHKS